MENFKLYCLALLLLSGLAAGAQTTLDEYNYCTKGYRLVKESGMTPKAGYEVETIKPVQAKYGQYQIDKLIKLPDGEVKALIVDYWKADLVHHYFCIPDGATGADVAERAFEAWEIYFNQDKNPDGDMITFSLSCRLVKDLKK